MLVSLETNKYDAELAKICEEINRNISESWYKIFYTTAYARKDKRNNDLAILSLKSTCYSDEVARSYYENVEARYKAIEDGIRDYYRINKINISEEELLNEIYSVELPEKDLKFAFSNGKAFHFSRRLSETELENHEKNEEIKKGSLVIDGGLSYFRK